MTTTFRAGPALAAFAAAMIAGTAALAQSDVCRSYRAELAALDRGGGGRYAQLAEQQRAEIGRMQVRLRAMNCSGFFQTWDCRAGNDRLAAMVANYHALSAQARQGGQGERRAQLQAAVAHYCQGASAAETERPRRGSGRLVCVRTCDGSFFPLETKPRSGEGPEELCQALCPGAETAVYRMPGDSDLSRAVSLDGQAYTSLPAAFRFQTARVEACSCRKPGQTWVEALQKAESLLQARRGDIIVTDAKAEELSRPKRDPRGAQESAQSRAQARVKVVPENADEPEATGSVTPDEAFTRLTLRPATTGEDRSVRLVGPSFAPVSGTR